MKAPKYQRMEMLQAAIQTAGHELGDPIDGLEMTGKGILAWGGGRTILISCLWNQGYGDNRTPLPGSGNWSADYVEDCDPLSGRAPVRSWWRRWLG